MRADSNGFERLGTMYDSSGGYDWSAFGVWRKGHQLFYDTDSGCSCNGPWDSGIDPEPATLDEIRQEIRRRSDWEGRDAAEEFIREIEEAIK